MFTSYLKLAFRSISRHKGFSCINIAGLAIGMACCMFILLWVQDELGYDRFNRQADHLYRVLTLNADDPADIAAVSAGILGPALKETAPEVLKASRAYFWPRQLITYQPEESKASAVNFEERGLLVDPDFFEMFTYPLLEGNSLTVFNQPSSIVLTETMATKFFGEDNPAGKTLHFNGNDFLVTGVLKDVPGNSHLQFDFMIPFEHLTAWWGPSVDSWTNVSFYTYLLLQDGVSVQMVSQKIAQLVEEHDPERHSYTLQPLTRIHLYSDFAFDIGGHGNIQYVYIFSLVALFTLVIACINFMNLSTARSTQRAGEIGVRKVVGAHRRQLIHQFLGEAVLLAVLAVVIAYNIVVLALPGFNALSGKTLAISILNYPYILTLVAIVLVTGLVSGIYPAMYLASFQPMAVLKQKRPSGSNTLRLREVLVTTQIALAIILIIGTAVVSDQLQHIRQTNLGFEKDNLVYMPLKGAMGRNYDAIKTQLLQHPDVISVTSSNALPLNIGSGTESADWEGRPADVKVQMQVLGVNYDFLETYQMEMAEGRFFSQAFPSDATEAIIVNEAAAKAMNMNTPLGKRLTDHFLDDRDYQIIGVARNFHYKSLHKPVEPLIIKIVPRWTNFMSVRMTGENVGGTLQMFEQVWEAFNPTYPFEYHFLDDTLDQQYAAEQRMMEIFTYCTILALVIACLGLIGLASFIAEARTREIGIRKVLGAPGLSIVGGFFKPFTYGTLLANLIAWPVAWYAMTQWLQTFASRTSVGIDTCLLASALALVLVLATVSYHAIKAAWANPIQSMRYD